MRPTTRELAQTYVLPSLAGEGGGGGWRIRELYCDGTIRTICPGGASQLQASGLFCTCIQLTVITKF
jgi:hypothetical protein